MLQNNPELKSKIDQLWDKFWSGGISNPLTAIEQITYLLFMKRLDEQDQEKQAGAEFAGDSYTSKFSGTWIPPEYRGKDDSDNYAIERRTLRWSEFKRMQAEEMLHHVQGRVFPFLKDMNGSESNFTHHMKNAVFIIPKPALLVEAVKTIDEIFEVMEIDSRVNIRLRLGNKLRPLHVVSLMTYCKGRVGRLKTGADGAFTHMNTGILDKLELPYPPIELQDQFAAVFEKVEGLKSHYQQSLADLETLYGSLSQKVFKGELDLSRVILITEATEEMTPATPATTEVEPKPTIHLPAPDDLNRLTGAESRMEVIGQWLDSYLEQLGGGLLIAQKFMESAQQRLWELLEDDAYQLSVTEYDHVKDLVFKTLESGKTEQTRNAVVIDGKPDLGNQIVIKAVQ